EEPSGDRLLLLECPRPGRDVADPAEAILVGLEHGSYQVLFVLEVGVDRPLRQAGGVDDFVEGRGREPLLGEDLGCRLDQALARLGLLLFAGQSLAGGHAPFWGAGGAGVRSSSKRRWKRSCRSTHDRTCLTPCSLMLRCSLIVPLPY